MFYCCGIDVVLLLCGWYFLLVCCWRSIDALFVFMCALLMCYGCAVVGVVLCVLYLCAIDVLLMCPNVLCALYCCVIDV